jgi:ATP-binding cassette subfamily B protein
MTSSNLLKLLNYLKLYKRDLIILIAALIGVSVSLLALGEAFRELIDEGLKQNRFEAINSAILSIICLIIVFGISSFFRSYIINNIAEKIINKIRVAAFSSLINRQISYFDDEKVSNIISKLTIDLELISKLIINFLSFFIRNFLILCGAVTWMFFQSPKLSLIVVITIPIILLPLLKLGRYVRTLTRDALDSQSEIIAKLEESFSFVRTLHAFNQQTNKTNAFKELVAKYLSKTSTRFKIRSLFFATTISVILSSVILVIWVGSMDIIKGVMTSGQMISFIYYAVVAGLSAGGIAEVISEIQSPLVALERVFGLIEDKEEELLKDSADSKISHDTNMSSGLNIEFKDVEFSYPTRKGTNALNDVSFKVPFGSFIGVIGPSGSGKSTIIQLLLKFYLNKNGAILVNGKNIAEIDTHSLRQNFAYVPQEPNIFSGTIKSNIAFSKPNAPDTDIIKVAETCGVMEFAGYLPAGLDTEIGERGVKLSGGQKQRIALARALLFEPQVLLLDEATSSLDESSEEQALAKIQEIMKGKTIISIAHRISSLKNADEILVVKKGKIIAHKKPSSLLNESDFFTKILEGN